MESTSGGSGEVHAHLSSQPDKGRGMSGKYEGPADSGPGGSSRAPGRRKSMATLCLPRLTAAK
mgnify:CR=1 FL=1